MAGANLLWKRISKLKYWIFNLNIPDSDGRLWRKIRDCDVSVMIE